MQGKVGASSKLVYFFGGGMADGKTEMKALLGGKGANLAEMTNIGLPVPPGFTISTEVCTRFYEESAALPKELEPQMKEAVARMEKIVGGRFGDPSAPLLVSVRSGARASMPGMMDTVLNLGLNPDTAAGLAKMAGDERFVFDSYRRFVQMYGNVVLGLSHDAFENELGSAMKSAGVEEDSQLDAETLKAVVKSFKEIVKRETGSPFPDDPWDQLRGAVKAVFLSWNNDRAISYRRLNRIPDDWGTAVTVQAMVFGNMGTDCATGVAFTRDPATGENVFYGEYLPNAQGEDVVAGIRTPRPLVKGSSDLPSLEEYMPDLFRELSGVRDRLERHYKDVQDLEFTIQKGKLFILQTRSGKRTGAAAVKFAVDMVKEGLIDTKTAVRRVEPGHLDQLLHPQIDPTAGASPVAKGLPASPGAASGKVVFTAGDAVAWAERGEDVVLIRNETSPDDIDGMHSARAVVTARGGMTSHAAVVARGMGKSCVVGCGALSIDSTSKSIKVGGESIGEGDFVTVDGTTGNVYIGKVATVEASMTGDFSEFMGWADEARTIGVRANADTPEDSATARRFGAEGIGLTRTEHMFFGEERLPVVQEMILAEDVEARRKALDRLLPFQREDFVGILRAMESLPVTIRLLDPPLHEFLPSGSEAVAKLAESTGRSAKEVQAKVESLREANPMLGHRGCRLGITYPEIYEMQVRAIFEAACRLTKEGVKVLPEIMIPLTGTAAEFDRLRVMCDKVGAEVMEATGTELKYLVGTMIEIPRACLVADDIARTAEFFSFGTNDLTQMTFGYSRDDAGTFLPGYVEKGILKEDPFQVLDVDGVGQLVEMGIKKGRSVRADLKIGICGEHGGEPASIHFCYGAGMNYVSCSPYRVPVARLAAAQAALGMEARGD
jgi:pyruvate,orthophosphate dikinase